MTKKNTVATIRDNYLAALGELAVNMEKETPFILGFFPEGQKYKLRASVCSEDIVNLLLQLRKQHPEEFYVACAIIAEEEGEDNGEEAIGQTAETAH